MKPLLRPTPVDPSLRCALRSVTLVAQPGSRYEDHHTSGRRPQSSSGSRIQSLLPSLAGSAWISRRSPRCALSDEDGSIVLGMGVLVLVLMLAIAIGAVGAGVVGYVHAAGAADAAALAAAPVTFRDFGARGSPQQEAARFAAANGTRLVRCTCPVNRSWDTRTVSTVVARPIVIPGLGRFEVRATSRATFEPAALLQP